MVSIGLQSLVVAPVINGTESVKPKNEFCRWYKDEEPHLEEGRWKCYQNPGILGECNSKVNDGEWNETVPTVCW